MSLELGPPFKLGTFFMLLLEAVAAAALAKASKEGGVERGAVKRKWAGGCGRRLGVGEWCKPDKRGGGGGKGVDVGGRLD